MYHHVDQHVAGSGGLSRRVDYIVTGGHIGWLFAFIAPNGKKIMVIDHDNHISLTHEFGHSVSTSLVALNSGDVDGSRHRRLHQRQQHRSGAFCSGF